MNNQNLSPRAIMKRQWRVDNIAIATENQEEVGLITLMALLRIIVVFFVFMKLTSHLGVIFAEEVIASVTQPCSGIVQLKQVL